MDSDRNAARMGTSLLYEDLYSEVAIGQVGFKICSHSITADNIDDLIDTYLFKISPDFMLKNMTLVIRECYLKDPNQVTHYIVSKYCKGNRRQFDLPNKNAKFLICTHSVMYLYYLLTNKKNKYTSNKVYKLKQNMDLFIKIITLINTKINFLYESSSDFDKNVSGYDIYIYMLRNYPFLDPFFTGNMLKINSIYQIWPKRYEKIFCTETKEDFSLGKSNKEVTYSQPTDNKYYKNIYLIMTYYAFTFMRDDYPNYISIKDLEEKKLDRPVKILKELDKELDNRQITSIMELEQYTYKKPLHIMDDGQIFIPCIHSLFDVLTIGTKFRLQSNDKIDFKSYFNDYGNKYGHLVEKYFHDLMRNIFGSEYTIKGGYSECDGIIETNDYIIIFEFTTESISRESLWDRGKFNKHIERMLFYNEKKGKKRPTGKLFNLAKYINDARSNTEKTIIPVLVTERYVGNIYMLNNMLDGYILREIDKHEKLKNSQLDELCIFMSLDDIEVFWGILKETHKAKERIEFFIQEITKWNDSIRKSVNRVDILESINAWLPFARFLLGNFAFATNTEYQDFFRIGELRKEDFSV